MHVPSLFFLCWGNNPLCVRASVEFSFFSNFHTFFFSRTASVLWRCWLGGRKGIQPVKNWVVGCWHGYVSGSRRRFAYGPADAAVQIGFTFLFLPFWYRLTRVVPDKIQEGHKAVVCVCVCVWLLQQPPHSTIMFFYVCMDLLTIHMWPVLFPLLYSPPKSP